MPLAAAGALQFVAILTNCIQISKFSLREVAEFSDNVKYSTIIKNVCVATVGNVYVQSNNYFKPYRIFSLIFLTLLKERGI